MGNITITQYDALDIIGALLNIGDFTNTDKLLNDYTYSFDNISVKNLAAATHIFNYLGTGVHQFSILKTPFIITLSNYIDGSLMKQLMLHSSDANSDDSSLKMSALNCYFDNKNDTQYYSNNKCLKTVLGTVQPPQENATAVDIIKSHVKCEPGIDCGPIQEYFTSLYSLNPIVTKVLDVTAKAYKTNNCIIAFTYDNNYSEKDGSNPVGSSTQGYYGTTSDIYVPALSNDRFFAIAHELTHYAMDAVYNNDINPYPNPDLAFGQTPTNVGMNLETSAGHTAELRQHPMNPGMPFGQRPVSPSMPFGQIPSSPGTTFGQHPANPGTTFGQTPSSSASTFGQLPMNHGSTFGQHPLSPGFPFGQNPSGPGSAAGQNPSTAVGNFHSSKFAFQLMANHINSLLHTKQPQNDAQREVQTDLITFQEIYPPNQIDMEWAVRYSQHIAQNETVADIDYYLQPLEDYYNTYIIPDMNAFLMSS